MIQMERRILSVEEISSMGKAPVRKRRFLLRLVMIKWDSGENWAMEEKISWII